MKRFLAIYTTIMLVLCFVNAVRATASEPDFKPVAEEMTGSNGITWAPKINYAQLELTVNRPDGSVFSKTFPAGTTPYIDLSVILGERAVEGSYSYELLAVPVYEPRVRENPESAGLGGGRDRQKPAVQTGYFAVVGGMIVTPGIRESGAGVNAVTETPSRAMDELIYDDLIVFSSLCVGTDCSDNYYFGNDTIALLEDNLRIFFDDTSNLSSFPNNDWRIVINDNTDGGGSYFAVQDVTNGITPFTVEAGGKANSLYVDGDGQVGLGTSAPVFELHIKDGDTPTVRLHQDNSNGWPEQIWDLGCNETNFFVRDGTHLGKLPFRIQPNAPSNTLCLKADGKVGIGTWSPEQPLEVETTGSAATIYAQQTDGATAVISASDSYVFIGSKTNHDFRLLANNSPSMTLKTNGNVGIGTTGPTHLVHLRGGAYSDGGTWIDGSSRSFKKNIKNISLEEARETLEGLNPVKYNYISDDSEEYLGFIAEDVPELVATKDRKGMSPMDVTAVLTKIVQEQQKQLREQQENSRAQQEVIIDLQKRISELERK